MDAGAEDSRTRTFSWSDPQQLAAAAREMGGMEFLQAIARGELPPPPIAVALGFGLQLIEEGRVVFWVDPAEHHYNPIGLVHGGVAATLCDSAMGCAVQTLLPAGVAYTTLELKISFTRAITRDTGRVLCEGNTLHVGKRTAIAEARVTDPQGRLCAHATTTCLIMRP